MVLKKDSSQIKNLSLQLGVASKQSKEQWSQRKKTAAVQSQKSKDLPCEVVAGGAEDVTINSAAASRNGRAQDVGENELRARIRQLRHVEKQSPSKKQRKYAYLLRISLSIIAVKRS